MLNLFAIVINMDIPKILKGESGLLFAAVGGAVLGDLIPTPGDALAFHLQRKLRDKWSKGEITSKQYWGREALYYYTLNSTWWLLVGLATYYTPGETQKKIRTLLALTGAGIVFSVIYKNIKKDEAEKLAEKNALKQRLLENANAKDINNTKQT
jgi:hypothetical protein